MCSERISRTEPSRFLEVFLRASQLVERILSAVGRWLRRRWRIWPWQVAVDGGGGGGYGGGRPSYQTQANPYGMPRSGAGSSGYRRRQGPDGQSAAASVRVKSSLPIRKMR